MICLHCGDCCLRMSPKTHSKCPDVIQIGDFYFCNDYENRPKECINHSFPYKYCPLGIVICGLETVEDLHQRMDRGYELIESLKLKDRFKGGFKVVCDKTNNSEQDIKEHKLNVDIYFGIEEK